MARPNELTIPIHKTHTFEYNEYKIFVQLVGEQNASKEIRAMIKNFIKKQQKKQSTLDENLDHNNNDGLDQFINLETDISVKIHSIGDMDLLNKIEKNSNLIRAFAKTRRKNLQIELLKGLQKRK